MRKLSAYLLAALLLAACTPEQPAGENTFYVSIPPLRSTLKELDIRTAEKIARSGVKYFIVYHPALTYYARDYGLRQVAIEADGKEPSAKQLTAVIRQAREDGVRRIFYQNQFPASTVEIIARDIDAEYVEIDPLDEDAIGAIDAMTDSITAK